MRAVALMIILALGCLIALPGASADPGSKSPQARQGANGFEVKVRKIEGKVRERMTGVSWRPGCPVGLDDLRLIRASFWNFDREHSKGSIVVHSNEAGEIVRVLRSLYRNKFKIRRMHLIERYDGSDSASMKADNTSGFNCRYVAGTSTWSQHAYGKAIDINPVENPYVTSSGHVSPSAGAAYTNRSKDKKGMVHRGDAAFNAFAREAWKWGGKWSGTKDYQHFSRNGA